MAIKDISDITEFYHKKRILITGASGYIAWNLIKRLVKFDCTIKCFSRNAKNIDKQKGKAKLKFIEASYQDKDSYQKAVRNIDIIFHLASQTSVYEAERDPLADYEANVRPMQLLLEACRKEETCPIIVFSGTSTQCGMPKKLPVDENVVDVPITTYDFHKLQAERWLKFYTRQGWVRGVSLRLTNVYGPGPKSSSSDRGILNLMIKKALNGEKLTIYGSGKYIRDYIYIDDVVSAFLTAPIYIKELNGKHFVLGSGEGESINNAIRLVGTLVAHKIGDKVNIENIDTPTGMAKIEFRNFTAGINTLNKIGLCNAMHSLYDGINNTINYYGKGE
jgi:UDP-glucose 4-epimerase